MKKFNFEKKYIQIAILAIIVVAFSIIFQEVIGNVSGFMVNVKGTLDFISKLLRPFFIAICIAYFLNPMVRFIEKQNFIKNNKYLSKEKTKRNISILITYIFAIFCIYLLVASILPSVIKNVNSLLVALPNSINEIRFLMYSYISAEDNLIEPLVESVNRLTNQEYSANHIVANAVKSISDLIFSLPNVVTSLFLGVVTLANGVIALVLGFVISIYMIGDKEYFQEQAKKIVCVLTKRKTAERIFTITKLSSDTLEKFIVGKAIDSFIIGAIFFVICVAFKIPYAPLFAIIIGVTNMIPYFGPFIGAVPVAIITLTWNYKMLIPIVIAILILQQFDGIILGPKILGDSIGLKPISIIFAIIVGGGMFGIAGMFLGAPIYAVIATITNELINKNYNKKLDKE